MPFDATPILKVGSGKEVCHVVSSLTLAVRQERDSRRGAGAGVGVCVRLSVNVGGDRKG